MATVIRAVDRMVRVAVRFRGVALGVPYLPSRPIRHLLPRPGATMALGPALEAVPR